MAGIRGYTRVTGEASRAGPRSYTRVTGYTLAPPEGAGRAGARDDWLVVAGRVRVTRAELER